MPVKCEMLVRRGDVTQTAINETLAPEPGEGELLLAVEGFAVSANTVTYAVVGDAMRYWDFFPAAEGWGVVPAWGHARVLASRNAEIAVGERLYGFMPMATHLLVTPGKISPGLFCDMAPHRQPMNAVYNQYRRLAADPAQRPAGEDARALFEPLFLTSFLIADTLRRADGHGAATVALTSASSKTALGTAYALRATSPGVRRIGLTSRAHVGFVEQSGVYDTVLAYDAIDTLNVAGTVVLIDFAGSGDILAAAYAHLPGRVAACLRVGATHHDDPRQAGVELVPKPVWFFAPDAAVALIGEVGQQAFDTQVAAAWRGFVDTASALIQIEHGAGPEALQRVWRDQVAGRAGPDIGHIVRL